jgi:hypothetical protein
MNTYRSAARFAPVTLAACAASLSLAACTAGITTASTATTSPAATSPASSSSASASASPALASRMLKVTGKVGSFPVPAGARVAENVATGQETIVIFDLVTPAKVASFYAQALPRAGYTITTNSVVGQSGNTVAFIQFTGHGFKGTIDALAKFNDSTVSMAGLGHKNVTTLTFTAK